MFIRGLLIKTDSQQRPIVSGSKRGHIGITFLYVRMTRARMLWSGIRDDFTFAVSWNKFYIIIKLYMCYYFIYQRSLLKVFVKTSYHIVIHLNVLLEYP